MSELERLQTWMQTVITHPASIEEAVVSDEAEALIPSAVVSGVIRARGELSACDRLEIYHGMYPLRMREALAADYPTLERLVGEVTFGRLVDDYVAVYSSRSYTLNRLGDRLPVFLETWGPKKGRALRRDLARLELAMTEVFDADEVASIEPSGLAAIPTERWSDARFTMVPALRLLSLAAPAHRVFDALRADEELPPMRARTERLVVFRLGYRVRRREVPEAEYRLLRAISSGSTLGEALDGISSRFGSSLPAASVSTWMAEWVVDGLFASVALS